MRFTKTAAAIVTVTATAVLVVGCGGGGDDSDSGAFSAATAADEAAPSPLRAESGGASDAIAPTAPDTGGRAAPGAAPFQAVDVADRKVVRTASMSVDVDDLDRATGAVRALAGSSGGFVGAESSGDDYAQLTLRVASERLDETLDRIAELGSVERRDLRTEDVTGQSVDLEARINAQRASVARVQALLDRAVTIGEVVQVESELTSRQAELESLEQQAATLADQVALATVDVELLADGRESTKDDDEDDDGFTAGLSDGWDAMGDATEGVLKVVGAALPFLGVGVVVAAVAVGAVRLRRRRTSTP